MASLPGHGIRRCDRCSFTTPPQFVTVPVPGLNNLAMLAERIESSPERRRPSPVRTPESPQSELTVPPTTHQSVVEALIEQQRKELRSLQLKMQPPATAATVAPTPPPVVARMAPAPSPIAPAVTIRALPQSYSSLAADTAPGALQQTRSEVYALRRATEQLTKLHQQVTLVNGSN